MKGRALHYVFKIADRKLTAKFYREILGMKVCRFTAYSKIARKYFHSMICRGSVKSYELGNDFIGMTIKSREAIARAKEHNWPMTEEKGHHVLEAPGGYKFYLIDEPQPTDKDPVEKVALASSNLQRSVDYWNGILGLKIFQQTDKSVLLGFGENEAKLELHDIGKVGYF
ncbi:hypothetical protein J437_LFUL009477 [Ladona fulva]|uniref:Glyoxalase domain-containing protein n=1 Tax=Ladona fulva TaxID=123851 RepID=A0A8K0NZE1_LADFU|nr:hypothetical protein J437_LFUL009477 [Ladona fulva]